MASGLELRIGERTAGSTLTCSCQDSQELLSAVREATANIMRWVALADGFRSANDCVVSAAGLGGAGLHYLNPTRTPNSVVDATEPEILLYEPQKNGMRRLVAVVGTSAARVNMRFAHGNPGARPRRARVEYPN